MEREPQDKKLFHRWGELAFVLGTFFIALGVSLMEKGGLGGLISDFDCFGNTGLPKGQTLRLLCERCTVRDAVYVGDTQGDMEASEQAGLPFVWAAYGFGKPAHWDKRIDHFTDLLRL